MMETNLEALLADIRACRHCEPFLPHGPRPIVQAASTAAILIIGQAPGARVHASGVPWDDASGDRLREWTGLESATFYNPKKVALMPMGFCFPGSGKTGDFPPRKECAPLWHQSLRAELPAVRLIVLVGQYAQAHYLPPNKKQSMTDAVQRFADAPDGLFPLPHPSWRSTLWMRKNPWFETDVLPVLKQRIAQLSVT